MSVWRKRITSAIVIAFVLLHLQYYVTGHHHWPFTSFPMFAWKMSDHENGKAVFSCPVAYGIPQDPSLAEIELRHRFTGIRYDTQLAYLRMLNHPYRGSAYPRLSRGCPTDDITSMYACASKAMIAEAAQTVFQRCEERRRSSNSKLPPLRGVKLYDIRYLFSAEDATFAEAERTLLFEWAPANGGDGSDL
jgi:hypothetical protein